MTDTSINNAVQLTRPRETRQALGQWLRLTRQRLELTQPLLACNRDDHLKNFAFLMGPDGVWRLAPLFDFTFHTGPNGWQTLSVAGEGRNPRREHLLKLANQVDLRPRDAADIIEHVRAAVAGFARVADTVKLSAATVGRVQSCLKEQNA